MSQVETPRRGRPVVFTGKLAETVVKVIRKHGITKGQEELAKKGVKISLPTMTKLAKAHNITFTRGRPRKAG
jgi:hypothetical protein